MTPSSEGNQLVQGARVLPSHTARAAADTSMWVVSPQPLPPLLPLDIHFRLR